MMKSRALTFIAVTVALVASACITEQRAILFISFDSPPPATVDESEYNLLGVVVRSPPDPLAVFTVTAITTSPRGVDTTVVQTGSAGSFTVRIPIELDTLGVTNDVVVSATDDTEDVISQPVGFTIIGLREAPALRGRDD
jgi:hypothetical protein